MQAVKRPAVKLLDEETVKVVVAKAYEILKRVGVRFNNEEAIQILGDNGASIDPTRKVVRIQEDHIDRALLVRYPLQQQLHQSQRNNVSEMKGEIRYHLNTTDSD